MDHNRTPIVLGWSHLFSEVAIEKPGYFIVVFFRFRRIHIG